jgi:TolB protein
MTKKGRLITSVAAVFLAVVVTGGCSSLFGGKKVVTVDVFWDTSLLQNVTRLTDDGLVKRWPKVSPDGTKMLYNEQAANGQWNVVLLRDVTVPAKTPLINGDASNPSWYGNSNNFVYVATERGDNRIIRSAIAGAGRTYVTRNPVGRLDDRPSVRGEAILFDTDTGGKRQIVSMKDNGTEITFLGDGSTPSWHPKEPKFLFIRDHKIYEMDLMSIQVTELYGDSNPNLWCDMPSYSPDGRYILFQKIAEQRVTGRANTRVGGILSKTMSVTGAIDRWQIFTMRADGTSLSAVTLSDVNSQYPSWDANGFMYFVSSASGKPEIYRARINLN